MFGFGKRKCKECGTPLAEMEAVGDRVDDLMRGSAMSAEPLQNICARCRVTLAKGTSSLTANLHAIEARRIAAVSEAAAKAPEIQASAPDVATESEPPAVEGDAPDASYSHGGGYKTTGELLEDRDEAYRQIQADVKKGEIGVLLDWMVTTKSGRTVAMWLFFVLIVIFNWIGDDDDISPPVAEPTTEYSEPAPAAEPTDLPAPVSTPLPEPAPAPMAAGKGPVPVGNPGTWITTNDYPTRALAREQQGTTAFELTVNPDGRVGGCRITQSSGHADLDKAACTMLTRRARFNPAEDESGRAATGIWASRVRWVLPE